MYLSTWSLRIIFLSIFIEKDLHKLWSHASVNVCWPTRVKAYFQDAPVGHMDFMVFVVVWRLLSPAAPGKTEVARSISFHSHGGQCSYIPGFLDWALLPFFSAKKEY